MQILTPYFFSSKPSWWARVTGAPRCPPHRDTRPFHGHVPWGSCGATQLLASGEVPGLVRQGWVGRGVSRVSVPLVPPCCVHLGSPKSFVLIRSFLANADIQLWKNTVVKHSADCLGRDRRGGTNQNGREMAAVMQIPAPCSSGEKHTKIPARRITCLIASSYHRPCPCQRPAGKGRWGAGQTGRPLPGVYQPPHKAWAHPRVRGMFSSKSTSGGRCHHQGAAPQEAPKSRSQTHPPTRHPSVGEPVGCHGAASMGVVWPLPLQGRAAATYRCARLCCGARRPGTGWQQAEPRPRAGRGAVRDSVPCPAVEESSTTMLCNPSCQARPPSLILLQTCQRELEPRPAPRPGAAELGWRCQIVPSVGKMSKETEAAWREPAVKSMLRHPERQGEAQHGVSERAQRVVASSPWTSAENRRALGTAAGGEAPALAPSSPSDSPGAARWEMLAERELARNLPGVWGNQSLQSPWAV